MPKISGFSKQIGPEFCKQKLDALASRVRETNDRFKAQNCQSCTRDHLYCKNCTLCRQKALITSNPQDEEIPVLRERITGKQRAQQQENEFHMAIFQQVESFCTQIEFAMSMNKNSIVPDEGTYVENTIIILSEEVIKDVYLRMKKAYEKNGIHLSMCERNLKVVKVSFGY